MLKKLTKVIVDRIKGSSGNEAGFTLIELVMVIVILGVLAATAIPKFIDLSTDATNSVGKSVAGTLSAAASISYAQSAIANPSAATYPLCDTANGGLLDSTSATGLIDINGVTFTACGATTGTAIKITGDIGSATGCTWAYNQTTGAVTYNTATSTVAQTTGTGCI